jgi:hypothetical protein
MEGGGQQCFALLSLPLILSLTLLLPPELSAFSSYSSVQGRDDGTNTIATARKSPDRRRVREKQTTKEGENNNLPTILALKTPPAHR